MAARILLEEVAEEQNGEVGGASESFLELESKEEMTRCEVVAGMVGVQQN